MTMMPGKRKPARNCPECGQPMTPRNDGGREQLGCSAWPECKHTDPLPEEPGGESPQNGREGR